MKNKTPQALEDQVRKMLDEGHTAKEIAEQVGVSTHVIYRIRGDINKADEVPMELWEIWDKIHRKYGQQRREYG